MGGRGKRPDDDDRRSEFGEIGQPTVFDPNLQRVHLMSDALGRQVAVRVSTRALRTVTKLGGLDAFLLAAADAKLPPEGLALKRDIQRALR